MSKLGLTEGHMRGAPKAPSPKPTGPPPSPLPKNPLSYERRVKGDDHLNIETLSEGFGVGGLITHYVIYGETSILCENMIHAESIYAVFKELEKLKK